MQVEQNQGFFPTKPFRSGANFMNDAHSAESHEKSYIRFFRFLDFELWQIVFTIYGNARGVPPTKKKDFSKVVKTTAKLRMTF